MVRERWWADSYEITAGDVRDVETREGLYVTPAPSGANPSVALRHGEVWRPKKFSAGTFVLNVWVAAASTDTGDTARTAAQNAYDNMLRAAVHVHRMSLWRRVRPDGAERQAYGEVQSSVSPAPIGQMGFRFGIEVRIPGALWRSVGTITATSTSGTALSRDLNLTGYPGTGPIDDGIVSITGPMTNPTVTDVTDGVLAGWFRYNGTIPPGTTYTFNCGTYATSAPNPAAIEFSGTQYVQVPAAPPGGFRQLRLTGTGTGTGTSFAFSAKDSWLV